MGYLNVVRGQVEVMLRDLDEGRRSKVVQYVTERCMESFCNGLAAEAQPKAGREVEERKSRQYWRRRQ